MEGERENEEARGRGNEGEHRVGERGRGSWREKRAGERDRGSEDLRESEQEGDKEGARARSGRFSLGGKNVQTSLIGSPWFAWFGDCEHMANQIDKNPTNYSLNQTNFLPIQTNSLKSQTGMQTNLSRHPNRHSTPCKPLANRCRTRPGIRNPGHPAPIFSNDGYNSLCLAADLTTSGG